ncbi:Mitogen-activated protein kinase kinase kinase [Trema orientale]|uniref:Mitogen-activated protein kinase kinase kinase n=1 Tax=Trema orientale TaxID=63057 RepID=A0A2P5BTF4_TREOI|nr:Mitogen-activated protein kinase kinase kinase [Trema orientale]
MNRIPIWVIFFSFFLLLHTTTSVDDEVKSSLISFLTKLSNNSTTKSGLLSTWNSSSFDPCLDRWPGVTCDTRNTVIRKLYLNSSNLAGQLDVGILCGVAALAASLNVLHLEYNDISGGISTEISSCKQLTHLHVSGNRLSGSLPASLAMLNNMKILDVSYNKLFGTLPDLSKISGLTVFLAENNELGGEIPRFDFSNLKLFNVSNNNLTGRIPDVHGHFAASSFLGNRYLCGDPLPKECPTSQEDNLVEKSKDSSNTQIVMFVGYFVLGLVCILLVIFMLCKRNKRKEKAHNALPKKVAAIDDHDDESVYKSSSGASIGNKAASLSRSEISAVSADQSALVSSSSVLVVLTSPEVNGLKFEDLLRAPAEMLGRGKSGSLYKVILGNGKNLVVKRIKDWAISSQEFKQRMQRLDQVKHPNVLPALAFYSSKQEKLLVYEYQQNGNLFKSLHGTDVAHVFDWVTRLEVAAKIAEALAFMHQELQDDKIAHGNLKSSNILLNKNMEPCVSEYGLIAVGNGEESSLPAKVTRAKSSSNAFKDDVYGYGVILLELLTGNLVQHNGIDLTDWVQSVLREEWTVEVFDKALISECASEERLVSLLQVAIKCVNRSPEDRPTMDQVAVMINTIKEEDERSALSYEP